MRHSGHIIGAPLKRNLGSATHTHTQTHAHIAFKEVDPANTLMSRKLRYIGFF